MFISRSNTNCLALSLGSKAFLAIALCAVLFGINTQAAFAKTKLYNSSGQETQTPTAEEETSNTTASPAPAPAPAKQESVEERAEGMNIDKNSEEYKAAVTYAGQMKNNCSGKWEQQTCIKTLSAVSMVMVSNYAADLKAAGHEQEMEVLKENCAATTAALKIEVPAPAMRSALTTCVNKISDLNDATGLRPDPNYAQMVVGSILCLDKNPACALIELSLSAL